MGKLYWLAGDLDSDVVEADANVGGGDESGVGGGHTVGGGLVDGGHGDGVGDGLGDVVSVGQGMSHTRVDEGGVSLSLSGPLAVDDTRVGHMRNGVGHRAGDDSLGNSGGGDDRLDNGGGDGVSVGGQDCRLQPCDLHHQHQVLQVA